MEDSAVLQAIAQRLIALRKSKGYRSYENFAFDHNIPRQQYYRLESGENMTIKSLLKVLRVHNMTLEEFFQYKP
jgi:hypothetical protein